MAASAGRRAAEAQGHVVGTLVPQVLERPLRAGEVSLDELERAFRMAPGPTAQPPSRRPRRTRHRSSRHPPTARASRHGRKARRTSVPSKLANQSIRVYVDTLEQLMTMVSELVLTRNQLLEIGRRHEDSEFKAPLQRLSNVTAELQEGVMKTRMQPIGNAWQKLPRIVRDLSAELGKPIEFEMHGAETELDRQVLDFIKDPLTHMVRNAADHGLEMPARAPRRRQARAGHDPALRLPRGRSHHHRDRRRRARPRHRAHQGQGDRQGTRVRSRGRKDVRGADPADSSSRPASRPPTRSPACPAAASAWMWYAPTSIRSAARST